MSGSTMHDRNADQIAFWDGPGGQIWTERQALQDTVLAPVSTALLDRAAAKTGERVVDVGCGCGVTTIELARRVGPTGHVLGIDVSQQMLARARERAPKGLVLDFAHADATVHPFEPARTDLLCSRFGVMFFAEPARSFSNMRTALRPGGRLAFACWREPGHNPWAMTPLRAAYKHVPRLPVAGPDDPGLFSFAREERVRGILSEAGFTSIGMEPCDFNFDMAIGRGLDAAVETALILGPTTRALKEQPLDVKTAVAQSIRVALTPFQKGDTVALGAGIWLVTAVSP